MHQNIPYIARLRPLENHTEAVDLYFMNLYLNRLNVEWISFVSLSVFPWMINLSGALLHVIKIGLLAYRIFDNSKQWLVPRLPAKVIAEKIGSEKK